MIRILSFTKKYSRDPHSQLPASLGNWLELVLHLYGERVLPLDVSVARLAEELTDKARAAGHLPDSADVAIAATAGHHGMTTLTRNLRPFTPLDIPAIDPFETLP